MREFWKIKFKLNFSFAAKKKCVCCKNSSDVAKHEESQSCQIV